MRKFILSITVTVLFSFYVVYNRLGLAWFKPEIGEDDGPRGISNNLIIPGSDPVTSAPSSVPPAPVATPTSPPTSQPPVSQGQYKDGQYQGNSAYAFYGYVQVQAVVQNGKLADVQILNYPDSRGHTLEVSNYAIPRLISEAISAQSADVNIISGATDTSLAFKQSLSAALSSAKN